MKIGIFDSGFGGLAIMRAIVDALPQYDYMYLGDTARTPYGTRSQDVVYGFTQQAVEFLFAHDCALVIVACNTASADAVPRIQREMLVGAYMDRRVLGVIIPAAEEAVAISGSGVIGVLATEGSVASGAFVRELAKRCPGATVVQQACPMFVPLVENGETDPVVLATYAQRYTQPLADAGVNTVILGCTHYEFLHDAIAAALGRDVAIVAEGPVVAARTADYLARHPDLTSRLSTGGTRAFCTTDLSERFVRLGGVFYGTPIDAQAVRIDN